MPRIFTGHCYSLNHPNEQHPLTLLTHLLLLPLRTPLPLILQELPLLIRTHSFEPIVSHLLFLLLTFQTPLVGFLVVACFSELLLFIFACGLDLAPHLRTEVGVFCKQVWKAQEVGEYWESGLVGGCLRP